MKNGKVKGIVLTLVGGIFWGVGGSCGQFLFENKEVTSGLLVPIRLFASGLLILVLLLIRKEKIFDVWKEKRDAAETLLFALFGMMLCQYSYFTTIQYSNAGTATVLQYTGPAMILVYLCVKAKRWPKAYEIAALLFSCGGVFVLATHGDISSLALPPEALFWGIVAAVTLVVYNLQPIRIIAKFSTLTVMGWGMTIGGIVLTAVMRPWKVSAVWDGETAAALLSRTAVSLWAAAKSSIIKLQTAQAAACTFPRKAPPCTSTSSAARSTATPPARTAAVYMHTPVPYSTLIKRPSRKTTQPPTAAV